MLSRAAHLYQLDTRVHLDQLAPDDIDDDEQFQLARKYSQEYRDGLLQLFFDTELGELTRFYGVF